MLNLGHTAIWSIAFLVALGIILRPRGWPEVIWALLGAIALIASSLVPWRLALAAVAKGANVYLFLAGMMLLAELARTEGLFDWLAALAARWARGSPRRLFALVYAVGVVVTVLLSNDATAVVLTPAVFAATRAARTEPLPFLFICAFIANAASFVLPISNPANLIVFANHMPPLGSWLARFALPSIVSIVATFVILRFTQRRSLEARIDTVPMPHLARGGRLAAYSIAGTAILLLACSAANRPLGAPTFLAGVAASSLVLLLDRRSPWPLLRGVYWSMLPLVASLFVLVQALEETGALASLSSSIQRAAQHAVHQTTLIVGVSTALACNAVNNLPVALIASSAVASTPGNGELSGAMLIAVDLGPNLAVTGSLATLLWLAALRREGEDVSAMKFLRLGLIVMPSTLLLALVALVIQAGR